MQSINPSTGEVLGEVVESTQEQLRMAIDNARNAFNIWSDMAVSERIAYFDKFIENIVANKDKIASLTSQEMGMPLAQALVDVDGCIDYARHYARVAPKVLADVVTAEDDKSRHVVVSDPLGVLVVIIPWNFPLANIIWAAGEAILAGNTVVIKHSEQTPLFCEFVESNLTNVFPPGVINYVYGAGQVGQWLSEGDIDGIVFTGSTATGLSLAATAAKKFIPFIGELGGSAPGIVCEDADLEGVIDTIYFSKFINNGQACDAMKRLIVHKSLFDDVVDDLKELVESKKIGDATDKNTDIGPLVSEKQLQRLQIQYDDAIKKGAKLITGGPITDGRVGNYFKPTILTDITSDMLVWKEEVFGPILPIVSFETEQQAIDMANDTAFGLGAYIFTENADNFRRLARHLETDMVSQNNISYVRPENPFGGRKMSGNAKEHGIYGFTQVTRKKVISEAK